MTLAAFTAATVVLAWQLASTSPIPLLILAAALVAGGSLGVHLHRVSQPTTRRYR